MRDKEISPAKRIGSILLLTVAYVGFAFHLIYPRAELYYKGKSAKAEIIEHLQNYNEGRPTGGLAKNSNRHMVVVDGKKYELFLQEQYSPQKVNLHWMPESQHALVLDDDGNYSLLALLGGFGNAAIIFLALVGIFLVLPYGYNVQYKYFKNKGS